MKQTKTYTRKNTTEEARELLKNSGAIPTRREKTWIDQTVKTANFTTCRDMIGQNGRKKITMTPAEFGLLEARRYAATRNIKSEVA